MWPSEREAPGATVCTPRNARNALVCLSIALTYLLGHPPSFLYLCVCVQMTTDQMRAAPPPQGLQYHSSRPRNLHVRTNQLTHALAHHTPPRVRRFLYLCFHVSDVQPSSGTRRWTLTS